MRVEGGQHTVDDESIWYPRISSRWYSGASAACIRIRPERAPTFLSRVSSVACCCLPKWSRVLLSSHHTLQESISHYALCDSALQPHTSDRGSTSARGGVNPFMTDHRNPRSSRATATAAICGVRRSTRRW